MFFIVTTMVYKPTNVNVRIIKLHIATCISVLVNKSLLTQAATAFIEETNEQVAVSTLGS